jgi:hypothetical protein
LRYCVQVGSSPSTKNTHKQDLERKNIQRNTNVAPALATMAGKLEKAQRRDSLKGMLDTRPDIGILEDQGKHKGKRAVSVHVRKYFNRVLHHPTIMERLTRVCARVARAPSQVGGGCRRCWSALPSSWSAL